MLAINPGDELEIAVKGDSITLTRLRQGCVFCGTEEGLRSYRERLICPQCTTGVGEGYSGFPPGLR